MLSLWAATPAALMWKLVCEYMKYMTGLCAHMTLLGLEVSGIFVTGCETAWERLRNPNAPEEGAELCGDARTPSSLSARWKQMKQSLKTRKSNIQPAVFLCHQIVNVSWFPLWLCSREGNCRQTWEKHLHLYFMITWYVSLTLIGKYLTHGH